MRLGRRQFRPQLVGEAGDDLVLHFEEIRQRLVEAFGPEMLAAFSVNELDVDAHAAGVALDRPFKHIADPEFLADFPSIDILALEREGGIAGDNEGAAEARQVGGQVLCKSVGEIVLARVVGEIGERQHNDGQMLGFSRRRWVRSNRRGRGCLDKVGR